MFIIKTLDELKTTTNVLFNQELTDIQCLKLAYSSSQSAMSGSVVFLNVIKRWTLINNLQPTLLLLLIQLCFLVIKNAL